MLTQVCELLRSVTALSAFVGLLGDFRDAETARAAGGLLHEQQQCTVMQSSWGEHLQSG